MASRKTPRPTRRAKRVPGGITWADLGYALIGYVLMGGRQAPAPPAPKPVPKKARQRGKQNILYYNPETGVYETKKPKNQKNDYYRL